MDFDSAEIFLRKMRLAHEAGDLQAAAACRKLLMVSLEIPDVPHDARREPKPGQVDTGGAGAGR